MKEDVLESLTQLEKDLQKLNSAREMVEHTVGAYKDVSVDLKSYSSTLSETSESIRNLIAELKANKDSISNSISTEMQGIIAKFEVAVSTFNTTMSTLQVIFQSQSNSLITELSEDLEKSTNSMAVSTSKIQHTFEQSTDATATSFNETTANTMVKMKEVVDRFDKNVSLFNNSIEQRFSALHKEYWIIIKMQKIQFVLLGLIAFLSVVCLIMFFVR